MQRCFVTFEERGNVLTCTLYISTLADGFALGRTPQSCADSSILDELLIENLVKRTRLRMCNIEI